MVYYMTLAVWGEGRELFWKRPSEMMIQLAVAETFLTTIDLM